MRQEEKKRLKDFKLYCEKCDWSTDVPIKDVPQWHNKLCPKCGKDVIVKDADMKEFADLVAADISASKGTE